jgi:hypothetical protein
MKIKKLIHILIMAFWVSASVGATGNPYEELQKIFKEISENRNDAIKLQLNEQLKKKIGKMLRESESFSQPYNELPNLGKIYSDDGKVRIFTWAFPLEDKSYQYGGFVQYKTRKGVVTTPLRFRNDPYLPSKIGKISPQNWYGALYYKVFKVKKRRDVYYIALGWSGNNAASDFKVIEPMEFSKDGKLSYFGKEVFTIPKAPDAPRTRSKSLPYRDVLEYSSDGRTALDYDINKKMIIFDHLVPIEPIYTDIRSYYGPDFTYDAYILEKGEWKFIENIDARNTEK